MISKLHLKDIEQVDVELIGICNLKCPLCISQNFTHHRLDIDIDNLILMLNKIENLTNIYIAGDYSEPTLHPNILKLLDYLKGRKNVTTSLFTNGNTHDVEWWNELNKHFNSNSEVIFTICGSTQELHEKYRVGSNLQQILDNAMAFKKGNLYKNDWIQYIEFEYNKNDNPKRIKKIFDLFSNSMTTKTNMIYERFNLGKIQREGICAKVLDNLKYNISIKNVISKQNKNLCCYSFDNKLIKIDNNLNILPCSCWEIYNKKFSFFDGDSLDYSKIFDNECNFCFECEKQHVEFLNKNNMSTFYGQP